MLFFSDYVVVWVSILAQRNREHFFHLMWNSLKKYGSTVYPTLVITEHLFLILYCSIQTINLLLPLGSIWDKMHCTHSHSHRSSTTWAGVALLPVPFLSSTSKWHERDLSDLRWRRLSKAKPGFKKSPRHVVKASLLLPLAGLFNPGSHSDKSRVQKRDCSAHRLKWNENWFARIPQVCDNKAFILFYFYILCHFICLGFVSTGTLENWTSSVPSSLW